MTQGKGGRRRRREAVGDDQDSKKISFHDRVRAIWQVAVVSYKAAPIAVFFQLGGAFVNAILPIVMTYYAALTTTELAAAIRGTVGAAHQAITYVIVTASLGIIQTAWSSLQQYMSRLMQYRIEAAVSDRMYEHFLRLDFWKYDDKDTIDTYDRASQFARFFPYVFDRMANIVSQFINMVTGVVAMMLVGWWLGLILLVAVIPGVWIQIRLSRAQTKHWNEHVETRRRKSMIEWSVLQPQYIAELRIYGMVRYLLDLRMKLRNEDEKEQIEYERRFIGIRFLADAIEAAAEVVALLWTVLKIINHALPIGQFIYVQQIVSRTLTGSSSFVSTLSSLDEDLANLFDYQKFMDSPEVLGGMRELHGAPEKIALENIHFKYPQSDNEVLHGVSFDIKKGQHVAIVGENGAGKSTLIKILTGLYRPTEGSITLDGTPLSEFQIATWHRQLGLLQQQFIGYDFATAKENVYFGDASAPFHEKNFEKALTMAEAKSFIKKLPRGENTYVSNWMQDDKGNKGVDLSGGQWQRLALARNFYRDSPIIILDEPTSAIDALAEARIFEHLFAEKNKTVITISHRVTTIKKADVIFMLKNGELVEQGTHNELVKKKGEYYKMFESQL